MITFIQEQDEKITKYEEKIELLHENEEKLKKKYETLMEREKNKIESLIKETSILVERIKTLQNEKKADENKNKNANFIEIKVDPRIISLQNEKEELAKNIISLESEQKRANQTILELKTKVKAFSTKNLELEKTLENQARDFNHNLQLLQKTPKARLSHFNYPTKTFNDNNNDEIENKIDEGINQNCKKTSTPRESLLDSTLKKDFFDFFEEKNKMERKKAKISICFQEEGKLFKFEVPPTPITQLKNFLEENQIPAKIHEEDEITNLNALDINKAIEKTNGELDFNKLNERTRTNNEDNPLSTNEDIMNLSLQTDLKNEMSAILKENDELKIVNKELTELNEKFLKEMEEYNEKEKQLMSELQRLNEKLIVMKEDKNNNEKIWEEKISEEKARSLEEKKNLENELRLTEKKAMDAKIMFADLISERDYFELEYRKLLKTLEGEGMMGKKEKKKKIKSIFDVFVCN